VKIALVTQWYDPETGSAAIPGSIARSLAARGHNVTVVTGFPNYPTGEVYEGYKVRLHFREVLDGVLVRRIPLYPSHDDSALRRVLNYLSFMVSATTLGVWFARRADATLIYSTPGTVGLAGTALSRLFGKRFVLYVQDVWPDTVTATGMLPAWAQRSAECVLHRFSNMIYRSAAHIAVISPGMRDLLIARGVPGHKVSIIYNWVDEAVFRPASEPSDDEENGPFEVMYAGSIGDLQGLDVAVRAMSLVGERADVRLRLVGSGVAVPTLERLAAELGVSERVVFEGRRNSREMSDVMASADVQLVCLMDDPLFRLTMPSKIQAILATGMPIITSAPGDAAEITQMSGAGWVTPAGDARALAEAFVEASALPRSELRARGDAGRRFYVEQLSSHVGVERLESVLAATAHGKG
jgi:glycosyltransferase involved in cell wall biosynthesis